MRAINVGSIEKCNAEIQGPVNGADRLFIVSARVELGHAHTSEAERRNSGPFRRAVVSHISSVVRN